MDGNAPNEQQNTASHAPNNNPPDNNTGGGGGGGWGGPSNNNDDRRGGYSNDRRGGYNNDRRGGYNNDRRGGYNNDRRGGYNNNRRWGGGGGDRFDNNEGRELYCGNLPLDVNEDELHDLFRKYGNIQRVKVMPARRNADSKFAFVEFSSPNDAQDAARGRDGIKFADNNIASRSAAQGRRAETGMIVEALEGTASTVGVTTTVAVAGTATIAVAVEVEASTIAVVAVTARGHRAQSTPTRLACLWTTFCRAPAGRTWRTSSPRWPPCCRAPYG